MSFCIDFFRESSIIEYEVIIMPDEKAKKPIKKARKQASTSKKLKYVGHTELLDTTTGELIPMQITQVEERDFNFHKVWLRNLIMSFEDISNQKLRLAFWIIEHLNKENQLVMTQQTISEKSGISIGTVKETMKRLQGKGENGTMPFLVKINSGAYQVNPDVIFKGSHGNRMGIIFDYKDNELASKKAIKATEEEIEPDIDDDEE